MWMNLYPSGIADAIIIWTLPPPGGSMSLTVGAHNGESLNVGGRVCPKNLRYRDGGVDVFALFSVVLHR
jgi:hypothetical protein